MPSDDRKSSEELIREANSRLRAPHVDDVSVTEPDPVEAPSGDPAPLEYRSSRATRPADPDVPSGPIEYQPAPGPRRSYGWLRWALAALVFGGWFLFTSLDDASRDENGEIVGGGDLDVMTLQVGDCFNDPDDLEDVVYDVAAVPCSEPHDNEVFAVETVAPTLSSGGFPGQEALQAHSYEMCSGQVFDEYVGTAYLDSSLEVFSLTPTSESWDEGDRGIVCALYRLDLGKLTGTARGSEL